MGLTSKDKICIPPPLFHCFGLVLGNLAVFTHGATAVYASETFNPGEVLRVVSEEKCTGLHGVPTMFVAELDHQDFGKYDYSSLRFEVKRFRELIVGRGLLPGRVFLLNLWNGFTKG
jgi:fatty-acyl-CoA synthase